jgi:hypothetical protein
MNDDDAPITGTLYLRFNGDLIRYNVILIHADDVTEDEDRYVRHRIVTVTNGPVKHVKTAPDS